MPLFSSPARKGERVSIPVGLVPDVSVEALDLSVRTRRVLAQRGITSVRSLLEQHSDEMLRRWWAFGRKCLSEVRNAVREVILRGAPLQEPGSQKANAESEIVLLESHQVTPDTLARLPLFSSLMPPPGLTCLHPSYLPSLDIAALNLSVRSENVLHSRGVSTLGELLLQSGQDLLRCKNFGRRSLVEVRNAAHQAILRPESPESSLDFSEFAALLRTYAKSAGVRMRDFNVLAMYEGLDDGRARTLEQTGNLLGVTRERVRQICAKAVDTMRHPTKLQRLHRFSNTARDLLAAFCDLLRFEDFAENPAARFGWPAAPPVRILTEILAFWPEFQVGDRGTITLVNCPCLKCKRIAAGLGEMLSDLASLPVSEATSALHNTVCSTCQENSIAGISPAFMQYLIEGDPVFGNQGRIEGGNLYSKDEWTLRYGRLAAAVALTLDRVRQPRHFTELRALLQDYRDLSGKSDHTLHAAAERADGVVSWDRGTFVHQNHASVPGELLEAVYGWASRRLAKDIPFVSVWGAFMNYEGRCRESQIPNEVALYSCMRLRGHPRIDCPWYPIIRLRDKEEEPLSIGAALDNYVANADGFVRLEAAKEHILQVVCLKESQFAQSLAGSENILRADGDRLIHRDLFPFDRRRFCRIADELKSALNAQRNHLSVASVYQDREVTCARQGIEGPQMLYSLLRMYYSDQFDLPEYPWISDARGGEAGGVIRKIIEAVRECQGLCPFSELEESFSPYYIERAGRGNALFRVGGDCLVHPATLEWTPEKREALRQAALHEYHQAVGAGSLFVTIATLIESSMLPDLPDECPWTRSLLADVLEKAQIGILIGRSRNVYVPANNRFGIRTLEDLAAEMLRERKGACNLAAFEDELRTTGVISGRLTPGLLGGMKKVVIDNGEILLRSLAAC
ncbi:MAG: hypothetical protein NTW86_00265 [Candidatus Sumerlaeota bacterium]|nr:hypothetical protein [Candidatus Sumerlaeota bacterium]